MSGGTLGIDTLGTLILGGWAPGALATSPTAGDGIDDRLLVQMEEPNDEATEYDAIGGDFRRLVFVLAETILRYIETSRQIFSLPDALVQGAWDLETAVGAQLDVLGSIVGLPRRGFLDERYRTFLRMQVLLIISRRNVRWTGTGDNLLAICRVFLGGTAGDGDLKLFNSPPYAYVLDIEDITIADLELLAFFLCRAGYAGVTGHVFFALDDLHRNWDSDSAGTAIGETGVWGSDTAGSTIADVLIWGTHVVIGGDGRDC